MTEAIAIPLGVAQTMIESLGSLAFEKIGSMWGVEDEFEKLKDIVSAVQAVLWMLRSSRTRAIESSTGLRSSEMQSMMRMTC